MWLPLAVLLLCASADALVKRDRWAVDDSGRVIMLRGFNQVNKRPPYTHASVGFGDDDAKLIMGWGFNVVRLGITWAAIEPTPGKYDRVYLASIVNTIRTLRRRNINVLLDMHQDAFSTKHGGAGFPEWAALGNGTNNVGFPYIYFGGLTLAPGLVVDYCVDQDFDHFWANTPLADGVGIQTRFISMIGEVARVLLSEAGVFAIDVFNEPIPGSSWHQCLTATGAFSHGCVDFDSGVYSDFLQLVIRAIRAHSKKIIFYEPTAFDSIACDVPSFVRNLTDSQLGYSFHDYFKNFSCAFVGSGPNRASNNALPLLTEFGANPNVTLWDDILPIADQYLDGWIYWTYTNNPAYAFTPTPQLPADPRTQGVVYNASRPLTGANVDLNRLQTLSRPYPRATAGIPQALIYDATAGTFSYQYTYDPCSMGSKITEVFIPNHAFPLKSTRYSSTGSVSLPTVTKLENGRVVSFRNTLPPNNKKICGQQINISITIERCTTGVPCATLADGLL